MRILAVNCTRQNTFPRVGLKLMFLLLMESLLGAQHAAPSDALSGGWAPRTRLETEGVRPFTVLTSEAWGNLSGGLRTGGWYDHLLDFGFELDTTRLGWWSGGMFVVEAHWGQNSRDDLGFNDYTGAFNPVSSIQAGNHLRVYNLHYQHTWGENVGVLKAGQLAADDDFMHSDYSALFLNSAFGAMPSQVGTPLATSLGNPPSFPIFPVAAPGLFFCLHPTPAVYSQLGLYCGRPGTDVPSNHGFDWADQATAELGLFWESGYHYRVASRPATTRLGLSYHTGPIDDFSGGHAEPPATSQSVPNFYLIQDLQLAAHRDGQPKLGLFWRGGLTPEPDRSVVAFYTDAGLNWFGPLPGRPQDVAGLAVSCTRFGHDCRRCSGPAGIAADETSLELTYSAQISRWLVLQGDAQWLFNPALRAGAGSRETAMVIGLRARVTF